MSDVETSEPKYQEASNLKVNKWMRSLGFVWQLETKPNQWNDGAWFKYGELISQRHANVMYRAVKANWWKFWK